MRLGPTLNKLSPFADLLRLVRAQAAGSDGVRARLLAVVDGEPKHPVAVGHRSVHREAVEQRHVTHRVVGGAPRCMVHSEVHGQTAGALGGEAGQQSAPVRALVHRQAALDNGVGALRTSCAMSVTPASMASP